LRDKETLLLKKGGKSMDRDILSIQEEIEEVEFQIRMGLAQSILGRSDILDHGLDCIARLDTLFARAAFGVSLNGLVPKISHEGVISVSGFLHPILATNDGFSLDANAGETGEVVPVDLELCSEAGKRALIISGPNGGGKTLSMKSFGVVSIMARLGIPIPLSESSQQRPRVDYFDDILVDVGDQQNVLGGESTWTAKLNSWASIISKLGNMNRPSNSSDQPTPSSSLVLLDELGSGTDPEAGGAVAQAILEELMAFPTCHVVATTHSPRLKSLSYQSSQFNCATMLLDGNDANGSRRPNFRLAYGLIGESHAMVAASRCSPALPESVLSRASELMIEGSNDDEDSLGSKSSYISALTSSMEELVERATRERQATEQDAKASAQCRNAMLILATSYENHLARLEQRVENCYAKLTQQTDDDLELVGETLSELRVVIKQVQSQQELLREKGLKLIPSSYNLQPGESVVVLAQGQWEGATVKVVETSESDDRLSPTEILVKPSTSLLSWDDMFDENAEIGMDLMMDRPIIVQRHDLAIWDYDSVWDYEVKIDAPVTATSVSDSKRRLNSALSTLKTESSLTTKSSLTKSSETSSFTSSRERKASKNKKGKKKKK
jgi:dsDNA-specific endonuclease/ATPase MutS2